MDAATVKAKLEPILNAAIAETKDALASLSMTDDQTLRARVRIDVMRQILKKLDDAMAQGRDVDQITFGWTQ